MFWFCPHELCMEMWWLFLWWWTHCKPSNPRIDKVLTQLCSSCRLGRGGGTCLALKSSQGAEKRRWSGGESVTGQLSNTRHHKIKWRLWYSFQSRQKLKLFKLWSSGRYYMLGITWGMVWFNLDLLGNVIYMNQKQFAFFNAMFEFLHFSYFKTQLFDWESLKSPNAITWLYEQINVINCWWGACVLEKLPNLQLQILLSEKHFAHSFSEYLNVW